MIKEAPEQPRETKGLWGTVNKGWFYIQAGWNNVYNNFKYIGLGIIVLLTSLGIVGFGIIGVISFVGAAIVSLIILLVSGWVYIHKMAKSQEWFGVQYATYWSRYYFQLLEKQIELQEKILKELEGINRKDAKE